MPISVLVVEDAEVTRVGLRLFLEQAGLSVVEAESVHEALSLAAAHPPDVAVVDLALPLSPGTRADYRARAGLELVQQLKARFPHLGVVILSEHPDQGATLLAMVQRGRWKGLAYLLKGGRPAELERVIHLVRQGGVYFDPSVSLEARVPESRAILESLGEVEKQVVVEALARISSLTPREFEVLRLVSGSLGTQQAAAALHISPRTVENHLDHISDKLGLHSGQAALLRRDALLAKVALIHSLEGEPRPEEGL
jgi:DNA-binding NarL/FixJ family response regulator